MAQRLGTSTAQAGADIGAIVAQLVEDVMTLKTQLADERWQKVFDNFIQSQANFEALHVRVSALEQEQ